MVFARFRKNELKTSNRISTWASYQKCVSCGAFIDFQHVWEELLFFSSVGQIQSHRFHQSFSITHFSTHPCKLFSVDSSWPAFPVPSTGYDLSCVWFSKRWSTRRSNFPRVRKLETTIFWESSNSHQTAELRSINRNVVSAPPHPHPTHMWRSIFITCFIPCPLRLLRRAVSCIASTGTLSVPHPIPTQPTCGVASSSHVAYLVPCACCVELWVA